MANRYATLTPSAKIKDDFGKITAGFDAVQAEMDDIKIKMIPYRAADVTGNDLPIGRSIYATPAGTSDGIADGYPVNLVLVSSDKESNVRCTQKIYDCGTGLARSWQRKWRSDTGWSAIVDDWNSGNFDPDSKVNKSGDTMTGPLHAPELSASLFNALNLIGDHVIGQRIFRDPGGNKQASIHFDFSDGITSEQVAIEFFNATNTTGFKRIQARAGDGSGTVVFRITNGSIDIINGLGTGITAGNGSPEGIVTANPGSIYLNRSGGANNSFWVKQSGTGNTGWVAK